MCMPVFLRIAVFDIIQGFIHRHILAFYVICPVICISLLHLQIVSGNLLHSFHSGTKRIYLHLRFFIPDMVGINQRRQNRRQDQKNINNHQDYSPEPFLTVLYYIFHYLSSQESPSGCCISLYIISSIRKVFPRISAYIYISNAFFILS